MTILDQLFRKFSNKEQSMLTSLARVMAFNSDLLERMLADIPSTDICRQPPGLPNHPAWLLGHLAFVRYVLLKQLGETSDDFREEWATLFGRGSTPCSEENKYPTKEELWTAFTKLQNATTERIAALSPEELERPHGIESLKGPFPTVGDLVLQMLTSHDGLHVGQLSDWRRTMGYPRVM